jgi:poly-gamma-glutamate capsule biosynthesis protein CapA/YwtB (metallophosphatase superfamily)
MRLARTALGLLVVVAIAIWGLRATAGDHAAGHYAITRPTVPSAAGSTTPVTRSALGDGRSVTIAFGGDVHFEGSLADRLTADPPTALQPVATLLAGADLTMVNLETAVTEDGTCPQPQAKEFVFHTPATAYTALRGADVTVVTQANNHGEDCGPQGLQETLAAAGAAKFPVIGIGENEAAALRPYRTIIKGQRIAIIAATDVLDSNLATAWTATPTQPGLASAYDLPALVAAVRAARASADTVIVYLHWGTETQTCPNAAQPPLARALVQAGADVVVGTHAHVQLGAGYLGDAFVDYGLGNLAFYDNTPPEDYSGVLDVTVTGRHIDGFSWRPAVLADSLPVPLTGGAASAAVQRWDGLRSCTDLTAAP